jgi:hypothetical protein
LSRSFRVETVDLRFGGDWDTGYSALEPPAIKRQRAPYLKHMIALRTDGGNYSPLAEEFSKWLLTGGRPSILETITWDIWWLKVSPASDGDAELRDFYGSQYRSHRMSSDLWYFAQGTAVPKVIVMDSKQPHTFCGPNQRSTVHPKIHLSSCQGPCSAYRSSYVIVVGRRLSHARLYSCNPKADNSILPIVSNEFRRKWK